MPKSKKGIDAKIDYRLKFSKNIIREYLNDKIYEKRGLTKNEYILQCEALWNAQPDFDPKWQDKIIIDFLVPPNPYEVLIFNGYRLEYLTHRLRQIADNLSKSRTDIACFIIGFRPDKDGAFIQIKEKPHSGTYFLKNGNPKTDDYYVATFSLVEYNTLKKKYNEYELREKYHKLLDGIARWNYQNKIEEKKVPLTYSYSKDKLSIWTNAIPSNLSFFVSKCADLLVESLHENLAMTASLAFGSGIIDISSGQASGVVVLEAEMMNRFQQWVGATFCTSFILNELVLRDDPIYILPEIKEDLVVPLFFKHLKPIHDPLCLYLTIDLHQRWVLRYPDENILDKLTELKKLAIGNKKAYYQNSIDFFDYCEQIDQVERYRFLRSDFHTLLPKKGRQSQNSLGLNNRIGDFPCIVKLRNGKSYFGYFIFVSKKLRNENESLALMLKSRIFFIESYRYNLLQSFLKSIRTGKQEEYLHNEIVRCFSEADIKSLTYCVYQHEIYGDPKKK